MSVENEFDVIIIGTGAGGGTLGYALAPTGKRILFLERGDYVPREKSNWDPRFVNVEGKYNTKEDWEDVSGKPLHPHTIDFWLTSEDLPDPDNRVSLNRDGKVVLSYKPNNEESHKRLIAKLESLMTAQSKCTKHGDQCYQGLFARNLFLGHLIPLAGVAHQNGTIRFGRDSKVSALDVNCKAHDLDNLYVVDGSFFPSSGAVNPALTIMANALRVADHLRERIH